ncbi:MAG: hypothetical protein KGJ59_00055 [Bacteroidota bacterium]|nr:hypothetical protein [Bacteroidota bacterium]
MKPFALTKDVEYYFRTDTIVGWQCVFVSFPFFNSIIASLKYCQNEKGLPIHGYVIMPNHIHTILSTVDGNLSGILRDFKRFTSRKVSDLLKRNEQHQAFEIFRYCGRKSGRRERLQGLAIEGSSGSHCFPGLFYAKVKLHSRQSCSQGSSITVQQVHVRQCNCRTTNVRRLCVRS